ncbi:hypothetical protein [Methanoculleus sp.]|uniref:hypothetical protein n=1 Tax=Methanoculleus sp. TaxID=90427 RepID=UPI001BD5CC0B|nr:hypothetical protein [Methanoculleus sp.]
MASQAPDVVHRSLRASRDSYVTFTRTSVRISSREDDAIRTAVRAPVADAVAALA